MLFGGFALLHFLLSQNALLLLTRHQLISIVTLKSKIGSDWFVFTVSKVTALDIILFRVKRMGKRFS
jgi:hypothetical protein